MCCYVIIIIIIIILYINIVRSASQLKGMTLNRENE